MSPLPEYSLIEVRRTIEPMAAYLAAQRATEEQIRELRNADDQDQFIREDMTFHGIIFAACHNEILEQIATTITVALRASRKVTTRSSVGRRGALPLHAHVMEAIAARKPADAEDARRRIIERTAQDIELVSAANPSGDAS